MLLQTTWNEIKTRYAGSVLGLSWLLVYPLLFLAVYSLYIFAMVTHREGESDFQVAVDRVLLIFCGLIPFFGFSEALSAGTPSVSTNAGLIKNTLFPIELIPVKAVLVGQCTQVVGMGILLVALAIFGKLTVWALLVPALWVMQILMSLGIIWILSSLQVFFRDLQNIIGVSVLMLMLVSPIAWKGSEIPANLMPVMYVNPLYYLIISYQDSLLYGQFPHGFLLPVLLVLTVVFFYLGYWFFERMKRIFSDNV
jgi:lipopolysaccharide transport system permease protein